VMDRDCTKALLERAKELFPGLSHLCGWRPATTARARTGWKRLWAGGLRSCGGAA
jgi:hypothetical protein